LGTDILFRKAEVEERAKDSPIEAIYLLVQLVLEPLRGSVEVEETEAQGKE